MIANVILERNIKFFLSILKIFLGNIFLKTWEILYILKIIFNDSEWKGLIFAQNLNNLF